MLDVSNKSIHRFGDVEVDPSRGSIKINGETQYPRQQTLQVLLYLIERRERLVPKDELIENLWHGTAVTDNALVQCIADIRRLLRDDPRHPRYVKTFPKVGYRFVAEVAAFEVARPSAVEVTEPARTVLKVDEALPSSFPGPVGVSTTANGESVLSSQNRRFTIILLTAITVFLIVLSTAVLVIKSLRPKQSAVTVTLPEAPGKKSIAVMYFDNQTHDADLDWLREGLADMLITGLSNSTRLTVLSRQQLHLVLERIGHRDAEAIQLEEALEVARKSRARIVILGRFARLGEQIRVDVQLHDASDGQLVAAERLVVDRPAQILTQADLLALKLASHLAGPVGRETSEALTSIMTNNLEAYRYYSLGVEKANALDNAAAIELFEKAVALDPDFAMAHARIGYTYAVSWAREDEGRPFLETAFKLSGRLTEKDKLNITAWYAIANLDYKSAIKSFQEIVARYPVDTEGYWRLGELLRGEERLDDAILVAKQGLVIDSGSKELYNLLGGIYSQLGRHDEAIAMFQRYVELAPEEPNAHDSLSLGYEWAGRYQEAITEYGRALALKPDFEVSVIHLGNTYFRQGRYREAIECYRRYLELTSFDNLARARGHNCIAHVQRALGRLNEAERSANTGLRYKKDGVNELFLLALDKGNLATAEKFKEVLERFPYRERGARGSSRQLLYFRGYFDLKSGNRKSAWPAGAVENFKEALKHRPLIWNIDAYEDCLGKAYLELGRPDEAIAEFERILRLNPNYPLIHYHMAQAYERKGENELARREYARFLEVWKNADEDVPEVVAARRILSRSS